MNAIALTLNMQPHPKERPRCFCRNGKASTYNSDVYTAWLNEAQISLRKQWAGKALEAVKKLSVQFYGNHAGKDLDNILGAVMDAMVHAGVLTKDNLSCISHIETAWERSRDGRIEIFIELPEEKSEPSPISAVPPVGATASDSVKRDRRKGARC